MACALTGISHTLLKVASPQGHLRRIESGTVARMTPFLSTPDSRFGGGSVCQTSADLALSGIFHLHHPNHAASDRVAGHDKIDRSPSTDLPWVRLTNRSAATATSRRDVDARSSASLCASFLAAALPIGMRSNQRGCLADSPTSSSLGAFFRCHGSTAPGTGRQSIERIGADGHTHQSQSR